MFSPKSFPIGSPALKWGFGSVIFIDTHFVCEIEVSAPTPESVKLPIHSKK